MVIVAVKYRDFAQALDDISPFVGMETRILCLLNGLVSEEMTAEKFGWDKVVYAMSVGVDARKDGNQVLSSNPGVIHFGEAKNTPPSEQILRIKALFDQAGIPNAIPDDMVRTLWWKLMVNAGMNQTSGALDVPYQAFQIGESLARDIMLSAHQEVVNVAQAAGVDLSSQDIQDWLDILYTLAPDGCTSMVQDLRAGRITEVDYIGGTVVEKGRHYGVDTPVNKTLVNIIHGLEAKFPSRNATDTQ